MKFLFLISIIAVAVFLIIKNGKPSKSEYEKSSYYMTTHIPYNEMCNDIGKLGEYFTYREIKKYEESGAKILYNVYLPKENGETTEIDLMMISSKGIFVFESKNYSGWIFGNEKQKTWTQTLSNGKSRNAHKEHFLNPIMQNKLHIDTLKKIIDGIPVYSVVVFSVRCELKKVVVNSKDVRVVKRNQTMAAINSLVKSNPPFEMSIDRINEIYNKIYPYSQVNEDVKVQHINDIRKSHNMELPDDNTAKENSDNKFLQEIVSEKSDKIPSPPPYKKDDNEEKTLSENKDTENDSEFFDEKDEITEESHIETEKMSVIEQSEDKIEFENEAKNDIIEDDSETDEAVLLCPKCGGKLILRKAKRGNNSGNQFYGCENYPKCKFIKNI